ncbi:2Fe-2S iron-sulfur cluster-binding protein [Nocardia sp. CA-120079]|uniref:2Fe-2S iron-sulfur cluster-binding protein n=1 Tax=Nocardia sp. CA-120079 TaxID=3239974 RepID=UPI003D958CB1
MPDPVVHRLRVTAVIAETAESCSLVFQAANEFHYAPGQFLTMRIPVADGSVARCYSLASSPHRGEPPKVTVKRVAGGLASNWICDHVRAGTIIETLVPAGIFTPRSLDDDLLLFAGGSGITPIMSIVKSVLHAGNGRVVLIYANQDENSVIFAAELAELARDNPKRLVTVHWLVSVQGLPDVATLRELTRPYGGHDAFLCGPEPFMDAAAEALRQLGFTRDHVHTERFLSLSGDPFTTSAEDQIADAQSDAAQVEVELDGAVTTHPWPRARRLLDVLLDAGLAAPYSCREGACSACACRVLDGEVKMLRNEVLEEADLAEGYVLSCQAVPVTDSVKVSYS